MNLPYDITVYINLQYNSSVSEPVDFQIFKLFIFAPGENLTKTKSQHFYYLVLVCICLDMGSIKIGKYTPLA